MKTNVLLILFWVIYSKVSGHDWSAESHSHTMTIAQSSGKNDIQQPSTLTSPKPQPIQAASFAKFSPKVALRWDKNFLYIESNGLPSHNMMVGITAWQQQVPLPQDYTGTNAWRIPLSPVPAIEGVSIKGRFLRGAIAIAANGIPIFNPQNNRGEISAMIGELDQWGGHCGRADDYHYHSAPLHLQEFMGKTLPIAYALDGYPIYGLTEPDGSKPTGLDVFQGHSTGALGYHYHASLDYPYVNGGFHGIVVEHEGQVDPQPRATPVREALPALHGAKITGFQTVDSNHFKLFYDYKGDKRAIHYSINADGTYPFEFHNGRAGTTQEIYQPRQRERPSDRADRPESGGRERPPRRDDSNSQRFETDTSKQRLSNFGVDAMKKPDGNFILTSPEVRNDGVLPIDCTGDGLGVSPPLQWKGAPSATKSYAILMDHVTPDGEIKHYWVMWDLPATLNGIPKNARDIGKLGTGFKGKTGYEPPNSKGPGAKKYVITVYALSSAISIAKQANEVNRDVLLAAIKDKVIASASLNVVHLSGNSVKLGPERNGEERRPARDNRATDSDESTNISGTSAIVKPGMHDTIKLNVYADNWFMLFINGRLVAVDPISFIPHNVVSVDVLPEYPMTIAVLAKDNADPKTGLEYGNSIGDGGLILKLGDDIVTNSSWKAKSFFHGPLREEIHHPKIIQNPLPANWWAVGFDDSTWKNAREYDNEEVDPKKTFFDYDFKQARFIWSDDIKLDNTVIFRTTIEHPGWKPAWNTKPDLDTNESNPHAP
jgi:phosphatidylethanolamine-binding protein (PEBP) family uncharacterized protein